MVEFKYAALSLAQTDRLGRVFAQVLPGGTTVALIGTLGAGKTRLVQAIASALNISPEDVTSPTFVLCQEYHGSRTVYHMDAYRIRDDDEFLELGAEEYFDSAGITLIEWADRVLKCLPPQRIDIHIEVMAETKRRFTFQAMGDQNQQVVERLDRMLALDDLRVMRNARKRRR